jgi:hypothetical protein
MIGAAMPTSSSFSPVEQVRLVVAVHFRVGVLKQQLGNHSGVRDVLHAIEVSKMLLGRFSVDQQMFRIVRDDGSLIPVAEQFNLRSLNDNLNITGKLNLSGSVHATPSANFAGTGQQLLAASSIYSSASSSLVSLMPKMRVPEPELTDPTESLRGVSEVLNGSSNVGVAHVALDGTRDMWRGEFAPGRLQLPDIEVDGFCEKLISDGHSKDTLPLRVETELPIEIFSQKQAHHNGRNVVQAFDSAGVSRNHSSETADSSWLHRNLRYVSGQVSKRSNVQVVDMRLHRARESVVQTVTPAMTQHYDCSSSVAAVTSLRLADPDVVLSDNQSHANSLLEKAQSDSVGGVFIWSQHQASPIVDRLQLYLQQQHEVSVQAPLRTTYS